MKGKVDIEDPMVNQVVLIGKDAGRINRLISLHSDKIRQIHFHGRIADAGTLRRENGKVVKVFTASKKEIIQHSKMMMEKGIYVCPEFPVEKREDISFITSMGIAVDLLYRLETITRKTILEIIDHYLHFPSLNSPVEPFHSILMSKLKNGKLTLWSLYAMPPDTVFYVDDMEIIERPGKCGNDHYRPLIRWKNHQWKESHGHNGFKKYFESIPRDHPGCLACDQFYFCFSWAKYQRDCCELWKEILDKLQFNAREIRTIMDTRSA
jgi:hypothetical protein